MQDLAKAREGFVLTSDMHLTYLVTPVDLSAWDRKGPDWNAFYKMLQALKVCTCRGIFWYVIIHYIRKPRRVDAASMNQGMYIKVYFVMSSYTTYVNPAGFMQ